MTVALKVLGRGRGDDRSRLSVPRPAGLGIDREHRKGFGPVGLFLLARVQNVAECWTTNFGSIPRRSGGVCLSGLPSGLPFTLPRHLAIVQSDVLHEKFSVHLPTALPLPRVARGTGVLFWASPVGAVGRLVCKVRGYFLLR